MWDRGRLVAVAVVVFAAACVTGEPTAELRPPGSVPLPEVSAARVVDEVSVSSPVLDNTLDPEGVIVAATLLTDGGDVEQAMADGRFGRAELDAARAGLADGTLEHLFD